MTDQDAAGMRRAADHLRKQADIITDKYGKVLLRTHAAGIEHLAAIPAPAPEAERYVVWSNEHRAWRRPNACGYTTHLPAAGIYSRDEALSIAFTARDRWDEKTEVPDEIAVRVVDLPEWAQAALAPEAKP